MVSRSCGFVFGTKSGFNLNFDSQCECVSVNACCLCVWTCDWTDAAEM